MISLSTTQKIQLITAEARDVDVLAAWVDTADDLPASGETLITTATTTDIVASPSSGVRQVDLINIRNRDTDSATVTVQQYNSTGTKTAQLIQVALPAGFTLQFSRSGWQIVNPSDNIGASFSAAQANAQSMSAGTPTKVQFGTEDWDTHGWYDNATNYRFTPVRAGKYRLSASVRLESTVDAHYCDMLIYKNGSIHKAFGSINASTGAFVRGTILVNANGTDFFEVFIESQDTKSLIASATWNFFHGEWVGD